MVEKYVPCANKPVANSIKYYSELVVKKSSHTAKHFRNYAVNCIALDYRLFNATISGCKDRYSTCIMFYTII